MLKINTLRASLWILLILTGCYTMRKSNGGGQLERLADQKAIAADILVFPGYEVERLATGLNMPTALAFDADGMLYVVEGGYSYAHRQ